MTLTALRALLPVAVLTSLAACGTASPTPTGASTTPRASAAPASPATPPTASPPTASPTGSGSSSTTPAVCPVSAATLQAASGSEQHPPDRPGSDQVREAVGHGRRARHRPRNAGRRCAGVQALGRQMAEAGRRQRPRMHPVRHSAGNRRPGRLSRPLSAATPVRNRVVLRRRTGDHGRHGGSSAVRSPLQGGLPPGGAVVIGAVVEIACDESGSRARTCCTRPPR